ncbi:MAG: 4Fe-4S dicluster domain-containing protein [Desulfamplus sp.]|nr:4Fe-4S dicluster domain-containing protein [Desulfamplus sp.]MBF0412250.1 4Fe-4S dicluster domain-containing protein [Desulfamplus sp.]
MARLKLKEHLINRDWCKGCNICVHFCPKHVLELDSEEKVVAVRPEDCICCRLCELRCPDLAIEVITEQSDHDATSTSEDAVNTSEQDD